MIERNRQSGFTLIELMVSMVVGSIIIWMLFSINNKMSRSMQTESRVSEANATIRGVRSEIFDALYHSGYGLPNGRLYVAPGIGPSRVLQAVQIVNNTDQGDGVATGPDQLSVFYTNDSAVAAVTSFDQALGTAEINRSTLDFFFVNELVVFAGDRRACLVEITGTNGNTINFSPASTPFNNSNAHCTGVYADGEETLILRFVGRGYRVGPDNRDTGILEFSPTGGLLDDWYPIAAGVINLQFAVRYYENGDGDPDIATAANDADGDNDNWRDWYNGEDMEAVDFGTSSTRPQWNGIGDPIGIPIEVNFSVDMKSRHRVIGASLLQTPAHQGRQIGDWAAVDLTALPATRPLGYQTESIYRWFESRIYLRNVGVQ